MTRLVVLLCGPPGAGKSTCARDSGLTVYDRDDPQWTSEKQFTQALTQLGRDPNARAVVIRSGATSTARQRARRITNATHTYLLMASPAELQKRVRTRHRHDWHRGLASITPWFQAHDRHDQVPTFPGWEQVLDTTPDLTTSEDW